MGIREITLNVIIFKTPEHLYEFFFFPYVSCLEESDFLFVW